MKMKCMSTIVRTGCFWLFIMVLLTAGSNATIGNTPPPPPKPHKPKVKLPVLPKAGPQKHVAYFTQWGIYVRNYTVKDFDASGAARLSGDRCT